MQKVIEILSADLVDWLVDTNTEKQHSKDYRGVCKPENKEIENATAAGVPKIIREDTKYSIGIWKGQVIDQ